MPRRGPCGTVLIAMPVARATVASTPYPMAPASVPAHSRRARSSMVGLSSRHFSRTDFSTSTPVIDHVATIDPQNRRTRSTQLFAAPKGWGPVETSSANKTSRSCADRARARRAGQATSGGMTSSDVCCYLLRSIAVVFLESVVRS